MKSHVGLLLLSSLAIAFSLHDGCCVDTGDGPIRVKWVNNTCFTSEYVGPKEGCVGRCCENDVFRYEFDVRPQCAGSVRAVRSDKAEGAFFDYDNDTLSVANVWEGYTYCFDLDTSVCGASRIMDMCQSDNGRMCRYRVVDSLSRCCPVFSLEDEGRLDPLVLPPPPQAPPPPALTPTEYPGFPYCKCLKNKASRLSLEFEGTNMEGAPCFHLWVADACSDPSSPCCAFDVHKIEFAMSNTCAGSVLSVVLNGTARTVSQAFSQGVNKDKAVFKLTNLNIPFSAVNGMEFCLNLHKNKCNNLQTLCGQNGQCTYALFEKQGSVQGREECCVVGRT